MEPVVSLKALQEAAKKSPLRKGMIVRCLPMGGSWSGFADREFYVLEDVAAPVWGHNMALRHYLDVDPDTAQMLGRARDKNGKVLFSYTSLPADCVEILSQKTLTSLAAEPYMAETEWRKSWTEMLQNDAKSFERWKVRWEKTGDPEHKFWMDTFSKRKPWDEQFPTHAPIFSPDMLEHWVPDDE